VLRFKVGSKIIYTKLVRHPGTRGQPFMLEGLAASRDSIRDILSDTGQDFFRGDVR
jgi:hypothetical protein